MTLGSMPPQPSPRPEIVNNPCGIEGEPPGDGRMEAVFTILLLVVPIILFVTRLMLGPQ